MTSLHLNNSEFSIKNYGNEFIILRSNVVNGTVNASISQSILNQKPEFIDEVISSPSEILLKINNLFHDDLLVSLSSINFEAAENQRHLRLPVFFEDEYEWDRVDLLSGVPKASYIQSLLDADLTVSMFGFIPGFIYIDGLPEALFVPRKENPAMQVLPNTIAVGGPYLGIYSIPSPGGWTSLGQAAVSLFDAGALPPTQLNPGDKLHLEVLNRDEFDNLSKHSMTILKYNDIH